MITSQMSVFQEEDSLHGIKSLNRWMKPKKLSMKLKSC